MEVMDPSLEEPQEQPLLVDQVKTGKKEDKGKKDRQPGGNGKKGDYHVVLTLLIHPVGVGKRKDPGFNGYYKFTTVSMWWHEPCLPSLPVVYSNSLIQQWALVLRPSKCSTTMISTIIFLFDLGHMNCVRG